MEQIVVECDCGNSRVVRRQDIQFQPSRIIACSGLTSERTRCKRGVRAETLINAIDRGQKVYELGEDKQTSFNLGRQS